MIAGFCGAPGSRAAARRRRPRHRAARPDGTTVVRRPAILAGVLRRARADACTSGPIASSQRLVVRERRRAPAPQRRDRRRHGVGVAGGRGPGPAARRRCASCVDTAERELHRPWHVATGGRARLRVLRRACAARARVGRALWRPRARARRAARVVRRASSAPSRSSSGRSRARAARLRAPPDRPQRRASSRTSSSRGAIFVEELDEVPDGATVDLLGPRRVARGPRAGGRARPRRHRRHLPARGQGPRRGAPLRRRRATTIVLVGHEGHEEVEGTLGEAPDRIQVDRAARRGRRR